MTDGYGTVESNPYQQGWFVLYSIGIHPFCPHWIVQKFTVLKFSDFGLNIGFVGLFQLTCQRGSRDWEHVSF